MKNGEISFSSKPLTRRAGSHEAALSAVSLLCSQTPQPAATPVSTDAAIIFTLSSAHYNILHANVLQTKRCWVGVGPAGEVLLENIASSCIRRIFHLHDGFILTVTLTVIHLGA